MAVQIRHLGSGRYSDCFKVSDESGAALAMKVSYYRDSTIEAVTSHTVHGDVRAAFSAKDRDAVSVSAAVAQVASAMRGVCPHIVEVYVDADVRNLPARLGPLLATRLPTLTPRQAKFSHVCLMELCACTLTTFVARSDACSDRVMRCLVFQVLYTLACLQQVLPGLRHNDLSINNVLVKKHPHTSTKPATATYRILKRTFATDAPFSAVLADFDFTHVPGHPVLSNERVLGHRYGISEDPDDGYDVHMFLGSLRKALAPVKAPLTRAFLDGLKLEPRSRPTSRCVHLHPLAVLRHPYFDALATATGHTSRVDYALPN